jgi:hypothetical protein
VLPRPIPPHAKQAGHPSTSDLASAYSRIPSRTRVTDELLHGPPTLLELGAQPFVVRPEDRLDVLGVESLRARGEADKVGEQDRHDLALASQRTRSTG